MRKLITGMAVAFLLGGAAVGIADAQQAPNVSNLDEFSPATNFMSRAGYLRWVMFQQTGRWITRQEAERFVKQQASR